jgi:exosortase
VATVAVVGPQVAYEPQLSGLPLEWDRITWALVGAGVCFLLLYYNEIVGLTNIWYSDISWSHGFVVPLISIFFIWNKWETLRRLVPKGATVAGGLLVMLGVVGQVLFRATGTVHMSNLSMLVVMYGMVLYVFGWEHLKILWLPITFLIFAVPPPSPLYVAMTTPMQQIAAYLGVSLLPIFGAVGEQHGTVIRVATSNGMMSLNVEEACSGMRMLIAFFALAVALAYSTARPTWQKVFLAVSALPIAILCNGLRVTLTGVLGSHLGGEWARGATHETLGLLMLIPALFMQLGMAWLLDKQFGWAWVQKRLFIEDNAGGAA